MTVRVRLSIGLVAMTFVAVATSIAPAGTASACSCSDEPLTAFADQAVAAFIGHQTNRDVQDEFADNGVELTFQVDEVFLGEVRATYRVRTAANSDACGVDLDGAGPVGIVAFGSTEAPTVGACPVSYSRSKLASVFGSSTAPTGTSLADQGATREPEVVFGSGTTPTVTVTSVADSDGSESNTGARAVLIGLLLVVLASGVVIVQRRRADEQAT